MKHAIRTALVLFAVTTSAQSQAAQVDAGDVRCKQHGPYYGRTDGICHEVGTKGPVLVINGGVESALPSTTMLNVHGEFVGDFTIPDVGSVDGQQGPWVCIDTAQSTSCAQKADFDDGASEIILDNGSEVGDMTLYWGDESNIDSDKGAVCVFRLQYQVAPAAADTLSWGIVGARNAIIQSSANNAFFHVEGANNNLLISSDDTSADDDDNDTGIDLVAGTFYEFMVSMSAIHDATAIDVRFFYRTTLGGDWTRLLSTTTFVYGADIATQPFVQVEKTSGTTVPDLLVDYIDCYWERS